MKVILLRDVAKIGKKGAVVEVPSGYAQNQLIPKGQAKPATSENLKAVLHQQNTVAAATEAIMGKFIDIKHKLQEAGPLMIRGQKSDHGHLFAALKPVVIVATAAESGITLDPSWLHISGPIKTTGEHEFELRYKDQKFSFIINVE